jgi:hypothetical protein
MIATGIDGLSRGDHESGIALGCDLRSSFLWMWVFLITLITPLQIGVRAGWEMTTLLHQPNQ